MLGEIACAKRSTAGFTEKIDAEGIAGANGLLTGANLDNHQRRRRARRTRTSSASLGTTASMGGTRRPRPTCEC